MTLSLSSFNGKKRLLEAIVLCLVFYGLKRFAIQYLPFLPFVQNIAVPYAQDVLIVAMDFLILVLLIYVTKKRQFVFSEGVIKKSVKRLLFVGFLAFVLIAVNDLILAKLIPSPPIAKLPFTDIMIDFCLVVLSGPLFEEILFRGLLLKYAFPTKPFIGIIISSLAFVLAHSATDWTAYWYHGVPAVALGVVYYYSKTLKLPVGVHMAINFLSTLKTNFF